MLSFSDSTKLSHHWSVLPSNVCFDWLGGVQQLSGKLLQQAVPRSEPEVFYM